MGNNRFLWVIARLCAEETLQISHHLRPDDIVSRLSHTFKLKPARYGVMRFYKNSIFPKSHYLEMKVVDGAIFCRLRVSFLDRLLVALFLLVEILFFILGCGISVSSFMSVGPEYLSFEKGIIFMAAAVGLNIITYSIYRMSRWLSGLSNARELLRSFDLC
ncbi:hypothetical protein [Pseudomonas sp. Irchel 3A5]|uniref:hypothetical protein n=1 Tax=Pseudomonas sp. Irchel 3A5 TaxID=2008911 RepID=UPI000BA359D1|nr:hypothetical protein [Pseudomonas sp. Irchel 3A5]